MTIDVSYTDAIAEHQALRSDLHTIADDGHRRTLRALLGLHYPLAGARQRCATCDTRVAAWPCATYRTVRLAMPSPPMDVAMG